MSMSIVFPNYEVSVEVSVALSVLEAAELLKSTLIMLTILVFACDEARLRV